MKKFFKFIAVFSFFLCLSFFGECILVSNVIPSIYHITDESDIILSETIPIKISTNSEKNFSNLDKNETFYTAKGQVTLLNIFPIKTVEMHLTEEKTVTPCGTPFGVKLFINGPIVISTAEVKTETGLFSPARDSGIKKSDIILEINGQKVKTNEELAQLVESSDGNIINISALRGNLPLNFTVRPVKCLDDKTYKIGMWVRDSSGGIGTLTFYDPKNNTFSGLGHGICDIDTGDLLTLEHGDIMDASIDEIVPGSVGIPGELRGSFIGTDPIGNLSANTLTGVYGKLYQLPIAENPIKVAMKQQVKTGLAKILTTIEGKTPKYYDINIESVNYNENHPTKNILISIIDPELLEKSGGIVQGMSGSPIIQNGMLIGAVTHVFINEPKRGYAIFSETMLIQSREIFRTINKIIA